MHYYQVEFKNPDDLLKNQTEGLLRIIVYYYLKRMKLITLFLEKITMIKK